MRQVSIIKIIVFLFIWVFDQKWFEVFLDVLVFADVPYDYFAFLATACQDPGDVITELHAEEATLFHLSFCNLFGFRPAVLKDVPDFYWAVGWTCAHHVWYMTAECNTRASPLRMCLNIKNGLPNFPVIIPKHHPAFGRHRKIMLLSRVPIALLNILVLFRNRRRYFAFNISNIQDIYYWIVTCC